MTGFFASDIWKKAPFVRLLPPLLAGMLIQDISPISKFWLIPGLASAVVMVHFSLLPGARFLFRHGVFFGIGIHAALLLTGARLMDVRADDPLVRRIGAGRSVMVIGEVEGGPDRKKGGWQFRVGLRWRVCGQMNCYREKETVLVTIRDSLAPSGWKTGALVLLPCRLNQIPGRGKKGGFDYRGWCARRHIYSTASMPGAGTRLLAPAQGNYQTFFQSAQKHIRAVCRRYVPGGEESGLLEALIAGYGADLDPELLRAYADSGVVHIIAISGLHLALLAELLQAALRWFGAGFLARAMRLILLLGMVWSYSLLTGASPSILRAAVMFSFVLLGRYFARPASVYNVLGASAFILLCDEPFRLWDTGFQLSYAAVLSLVLFATPVRNWIRPKNKILGSLWTAASVSIAAQLLTTPLTLWYFHQFPFYFLLSNLVTVPLSSLILVGGIGLQALAAWPAAASFLGHLLHLALAAMNGFVRYSNRLPGAVERNISIGLPQVVLCYTLIYTVCRFCDRGGKKWFWAILVQVILFLSTKWLMVDGVVNS